MTNPDLTRKPWTGPIDGDLDAMSTLVREIPPERTPFCEIDEHEVGCTLRMRGLVRGAFCDCDASDEGSLR